MELAFGRVIFDTYGNYAADPAAIADMLDQAVTGMQARAARYAGVRRSHAPTIEDPFMVVLVDELAFLTAYLPDRKLNDRIIAALATLTTQGRAVGYCVVGGVAGPAQGSAVPIRNLFPDRIAMRLDEPEQVDMVLGDGARDRGAACELIPIDPTTGAGVAYVRLEADPDPVRVRAGWVSDADIRALADACIPAYSRPHPSGPHDGRRRPVSWRTDEPCPVCATGLIMHEHGAGLQAECRLCGWADTWTTDQDGGDQ